MFRKERKNYTYYESANVSLNAIIDLVMIGVDDLNYVFLRQNRGFSLIHTTRTP